MSTPADSVHSLDASGPERSRRRRLELRQRETVKPLELFYDLVFVLGFTQCTALMTAEPTWAGLGRGMLVLAVIWWAWVCYAWLTNLIEPEEGAVRLAMFTYLPTRSLLTRATKSSGLNSMSSTFAFSLAAM